MRTLYLLIIIYIGLALSACTSLHEAQPLDTAHKKTASLKQCPQKNPLDVTVYFRTSPKKPYQIVGEETISKYNLGGIKRQAANIHDAMRNLAASMGGDAVINVKHRGKTITATVITYKNNQLA